MSCASIQNDRECLVMACIPSPSTGQMIYDCPGVPGVRDI